MTYYGGKELAAAFRTVRKNTIQIAEDIPEEKYDFKPSPESRTIGQTLAHIARRNDVSDHACTASRIDRHEDLDFQEFMKQVGAEEAKPRNKAEIVAMLKSGRRQVRGAARIASESVPRRSRSRCRPAASRRRETRFDMLLSREGARNAPSRPADDDAADDRRRAAPDAADAGADGADAGAGRDEVDVRDSFPASRPRRCRFCGALKRNNRREWFNAHKDEYERDVPRADDRRRSSGWPWTSGRSRRISSRARSGRCTGSIATSAFSEDKKPLQDARRGRVSRAATCRSTRAPGCTFMSRPTVCGWAAGCTRRRRRSCAVIASTSPPISRRLRAIVAAPAFRRTVGALEGDRLQRVPRGFPEGSRGRRVPEASAVSRRLRISGGVRDEPEVLQRPARRLPADRAARSLSERAAPCRTSGR